MRFGEALKFHPPLTPYKINKTIITQMPQDIQFALVGIDLNETGSVVRALERLEEARSKPRGENKALIQERGTWQPREYVRQSIPIYNNKYNESRPRYDPQRSWPNSNSNVNIAGDGVRDRRNNNRPGNWREKQDLPAQNEVRKSQTRNIRELSAIEVDLQSPPLMNLNSVDNNTHDIHTIAEIHACNESSENDYAAHQ